MDPTRAKPGMEVACCSMMKERPATNTTAERSALAFCPSWKVAVPLPVPEIALVNVTQLGIFVIAQEQLELVAMSMESVPPVEEKTLPPGLMP